eukprot:Plantae.Rhodophyta-Hildenbrandia_rubra.ctg3423.p1 GENE.Plantae.Rhodophyta-Hildenbrandia_rubra.ctg3423~~Plantae.Rhodophyta-Hildenbrandia_rubra.ctg3423.p1  ORF type:complete len:304 (-),score=85.07 Plantae.Rhodophyta-Hildenbrandia_rubra.ctg3423:303-1214(-)
MATKTASAYEDEGKNLMETARKQMKGKSGFFSSLFSGGSSNKFEEAAETFASAGGKLSLARSWALAGQAFMESAEAYSKVPDSKYNVATKYEEAGKMYQNVNVNKAADVWEKAVQAFMDLDPPNASRCAKICSNLSEIYEKLGNKDKEMESCTRAAEFYHLAGLGTHATSMKRRIAELKGKNGMFAEAAEVFEEIGRGNAQNKTLKYSVKEDLLKAGICWLCLGDDVRASRAMAEYTEIDPTFAESREGKLLESMIGAVEESNVEAFTAAVQEYDSISTLDSWKTTMMLKIKTSIKDDEEDLT